MAATILSHQSSTGFYKAPVCKGLMCSMFLTCSAIHVPMLTPLRQHLACEIPQVLAPNHLWKLLFNRLTFIYSKDIICSAIIIYYFRLFERRMGSRKFASYLLGCCTIATCLEISALLIMTHLFEGSSSMERFLPPGLYSIIFPLYVNYFLDIPRVTVTNLFGIPVTGKTVTYLLGLQIASSTLSTITASICGIFAGILYRKNFLRIQNWIFVPKWMANFCDKFIGSVLYSKLPKENLPMGATIELQREEQAEQWEQEYIQNRARELRRNRGQGYSERLVDGYQQEGVLNFFFRQRAPQLRAEAAVVEPSEQNILTLVDMGFDRAQAAEALRSAADDLQTATSLLLRR